MAALVSQAPGQAETTAFWLFDEPLGCYPSTTLTDNGPQDITVVLGRGAVMAPGRFGNALAVRAGIQSNQAATVTINRIDFAQGVPRLIIGDLPQPPLAFFFNSAMKDGQEHLPLQVALSGRAGCHLYALPFVGWPWTLSDNTPADYSIPDATLDRFIKADPQARFILRIYPMTGPTWEGYQTLPPGDLVVFADGSKARISDASDRAWELFQDNFRRMVRRYRATPYWDRIAGFQVGGMEDSEWFHANYREKGPDLSEANQRQFRAYLKEKYGTDEVLAKAWGRPGMGFDRVYIPVIELGRLAFKTITIQDKRLDPTLRAFYDLPGQRDWVDYSLYASDLMARRIGQCARMIKEFCGGEKLSVFFHGYAFELSGSFHGHLATGRVLRNRDVDILAAPVSYLPLEDRVAGGAAGFMSAVDSVTAHGKLWMNEDDMRTHLIAVDRLPDWLNQVQFGTKMRSPAETIGCLERNMAALLTHRAGAWWMDLIAAGAFQDIALWDIQKRRLPLFRERMDRPEPYRPEVGVIIDEVSQAYVRSDWDVPFNTLVLARNASAKTGVAVGYYYLEDFIGGIVPRCKAYFFVNAYSLSDDRINLIRRRLDREQATAIWQYAPGAIGPDGLDLERSRRLTGLTLKAVDGKLGSRGCGALEGLAWAWDGARTHPVSPRICVEDDGAESLAHYDQDGKVSAAVRKSGRHYTMFVGDFALTADLLRRLFERAGAHIWTRGGEVVHTDGRILMVHSGPGGELAIYPPGGARLRPLDEARPMRQDGKTFKAEFTPGESRWFRIEWIAESAPAANG